MNKEILILNSRLVTYEFENGRKVTCNRVTFAFRSDDAEKEIVGFDNILSCSLDSSSFELTKTIKPNVLVNAILGTKKAKDNTFKYTIKKINNIEL